MSRVYRVTVWDGKTGEPTRCVWIIPEACDVDQMLSRIQEFYPGLRVEVVAGAEGTAKDGT